MVLIEEPFQAPLQLQNPQPPQLLKTELSENGVLELVVAVEGDLLYWEVLEQAFDVFLGGELGGEDVEGGDVFVGLQDMAECLERVGAVIDDELVGTGQLDLLGWAELFSEGRVDGLLLLELLLDFLWFPASSRARSLPRLVDRLDLTSVHDLHFFNRLISSLVALPPTLSQVSVRHCLILHFVHVLFLQVEDHVGVIECQIQDIDDFVAQVAEGTHDVFFDGLCLH